MSEINYIKELPEGTFPINLNFIQQHQRVEPILMAEYKNGMYHKGYFCGSSNDNLSLTMCEDKTCIPSKLQIYVLHWYHTYILSSFLDITESIICQHLNWTDIRYSVQKELTNCDTCQHKKWSNKKYGKLPAKLDEEIPWNKLCVYLIWPYAIRIKVKK